MNFTEKWHDAVERKNSVLCAGLDPADFKMGRGAEGLPEGDNKRDWSERYIEAILPYVAAIKPNIQYWKGKDDGPQLNSLCEYARLRGLLVIDDSKLADIGSTNDAGVYYASERADAVTVAPFAGNLKEAVEQGKKRDIGIIPMCLMSNPEYETEKNKLVPLSIAEANGVVDDADVVCLAGIPYAKQYVYLAASARKYGADGIVVGAPSDKNHILEEEIELALRYGPQLILLPGVGKQGGEAASIWQYAGANDVIVNVGRALMFPDSGTQREAAQHYRSMLNELRAA